MSPPHFSVIIPAYNSASTLRRAVESVLAQSWPAHEIIIVDDASTDQTPKIAAQLGPSVRCFRQEPNQGVAAARNFGAEQATGDWLAFLDADDWYFPHRLRLHAEWIAQDPSLDFLTGNYEYRDESGTLLGLSMPQHASGRAALRRSGTDGRTILQETDFESFVTDHFGDTHTLSVSRQLFHRVGGYPLGFKVCEDVHFLTRLVAQSTKIGVTCQPLGVYLIHATSATRRDPVKAQRENVRTLLGLKEESKQFPASVRRGVIKRLCAARLNLGYALAKRGHRAGALKAVFPSLFEAPGVASLRNLLAVLT